MHLNPYALEKNAQARLAEERQAAAKRQLARAAQQRERLQLALLYARVAAVLRRVRDQLNRAKRPVPAE